jgi:hypothetical protein
MPINKGDRVALLHGIFGTALAAEANGSVQVVHDSGAVSTWAAGDVAVISRSPLGPASPSGEPSGRAVKRRPTKKVAKKRVARARKPAKAKAKKKTATVKKKRAGKKRTRKPG